ncbi:MAG: phosphoribosyltransferase family protein [bacterium]
MRLYRDRTEAGRTLAVALAGYRDKPEVLVLALPRGGVEVACEVARELRAELDIMIVRKLGFPGQEELAMGAIATGGVRIMNPEVAGEIPEQIIERVAERESEELRRREMSYRGDRPAPRLGGRRVILVDDGLATGATMRASIAAVRRQDPEEVVVAVPVAPRTTVDRLREEADEVICPATPSLFYAIGEWYEDFSQTSDQEVRALLRRAWDEHDDAAQPRQ